jgi:hypothetical protein
MPQEFRMLGELLAVVKTHGAVCDGSMETLFYDHLSLMPAWAEYASEPVRPPAAVNDWTLQTPDDCQTPSLVLRSIERLAQAHDVIAHVLMLRMLDVLVKTGLLREEILAMIASDVDVSLFTPLPDTRQSWTPCERCRRHPVYAIENLQELREKQRPSTGNLVSDEELVKMLEGPHPVDWSSHPDVSGRRCIAP